MPFQSTFTLFIIGGAFAATGALLGSLNYLYEGKRQRSIGNDHFAHHLEQRDMAIKKVFGKSNVK